MTLNRSESAKSQDRTDVPILSGRGSTFEMTAKRTDQPFALAGNPREPAIFGGDYGIADAGN